MKGKINQTAFDPEIPQGGQIKEIVNWQASVPDSHTFALVSVYGTGSSIQEIYDSMVAMGAIAVNTTSASRTDDIFTLIPEDAPIGTYSCATIICESYNGGFQNVYDSKIDASVLTIVPGLGAKIISTSFSKV